MLPRLLTSWVTIHSLISRQPRPMPSSKRLTTSGLLSSRPRVWQEASRSLSPRPAGRVVSFNPFSSQSKLASSHRSWLCHLLMPRLESVVLLTNISPMMQWALNNETPLLRSRTREVITLRSAAHSSASVMCSGTRWSTPTRRRLTSPFLLPL